MRTLAFLLILAVLWGPPCTRARRVPEPHYVGEGARVLSQVPQPVGACPEKGQLSCVSNDLSVTGLQAYLTQPGNTALMITNRATGEKINLLSKLPIDAFLSTFTKIAPPALSQCTLPVLKASTVLALDDSTEMGRFLDACSLAPLNPANSYLFAAIPRISTLADARFLNNTAIAQFKSFLAGLGADLTACLAINPCSPDLDILMGVKFLELNLQFSFVTVTVTPQSLGFSKQGTLVPPDLLSAATAPRVWTPELSKSLSRGSDAAVQGTGNLYLGGGLGVGVGLAGKVEVKLDGQGWVMGRYSQPSEQVVVRLQAAPSLKIWKLPAINLGQMETVFQYRDSQVWLSLQRRASVSDLVKSVPVIGEALSKVLQSAADAQGSVEMDIYASWNGTAAAPNGGAVRLRFGAGFKIAGPVADILGLGKEGVTLNVNFGVILMAGPQDTKFRLIFDLNGKLFAIPFCSTDSECGPEMGCHLFVCGPKYGPGVPCLRGGECKSGRCELGISPTARSCVECKSDAECPSGYYCDESNIFARGLYTCKPIGKSCHARYYTPSSPDADCKPGYFRNAATCHQECWGERPKTCGSALNRYCAIPTDTCPLRAYIEPWCPVRGIFDAFDVCSPPVQRLTGPASGPAVPCPVGTTLIWEGLIDGASPLRESTCAQDCPAHHPYPILYHGVRYCSQEPDTVPDIIRGNPGQCIYPEATVLPHVNQNNGQGWGQWSKWRMCPPNQYVHEVALKVERPQGALGDDVGAVAIAVKCWDRSNAVYKSQLNADNQIGKWGDWTAWFGCRQPLQAVRVKTQPNQKGGDDSAMNNLGFIAPGCEQAEIPHRGGNWGSWSAYSYCPTGTSICGFRQMVDPVKCAGLGCDDTALNRVEFACCK